MPSPISFPPAASFILPHAHTVPGNMSTSIPLPTPPDLFATATQLATSTSLPLLFPAMLAGGFLSFIISFDNFMISYFLIPTGLSTLPIEIYASIKFGFTPEINAVSTIIIVATMSLLVLMAMVMRSSLKNMFK